MLFEKPDLKSVRPASACLFKIVLWGGIAGSVLLSILQLVQKSIDKQVYIT